MADGGPMGVHDGSYPESYFFIPFMLSVQPPSRRLCAITKNRKACSATGATRRASPPLSGCDTATACVSCVLVAVGCRWMPLDGDAACICVELEGPMCRLADARRQPQDDGCAKTSNAEHMGCELGIAHEALLWRPHGPGPDLFYAQLPNLGSRSGTNKDDLVSGLAGIN